MPASTMDLYRESIEQIAEQQRQIAALQDSLKQALELHELMAMFVGLKHDNPDWHFWIAPDEDGNDWAAGFTNGKNKEEWEGNYTGSCPSASQALQWVLDNFEVEG